MADAPTTPEPSAPLTITIRGNYGMNVVGPHGIVINVTEIGRKYKATITIGGDLPRQLMAPGVRSLAAKNRQRKRMNKPPMREG